MGYSQHHFDFSIGYGINKSLDEFYNTELRGNIELDEQSKIWFTTSVLAQWNTTADYQIYPKIGLTKGIVDKKKIKLSRITLGTSIVDTQLIFDEFTRLEEMDNWKLQPFVRIDTPFLPLYRLKKNSHRVRGWNMMLVMNFNLDGGTFGIGLRPKLNRY